VAGRKDSFSSDASPCPRPRARSRSYSSSARTWCRARELLGLGDAATEMLEVATEEECAGEEGKDRAWNAAWAAVYSADRGEAVAAGGGANDDDDEVHPFALVLALAPGPGK
jgi:hypothetical protein